MCASILKPCKRIVAEFIEDCATIRKAMLKINELSADMNPVNFNQVSTHLPH